MMKELIWPPWFDVGMETGGHHIACHPAFGARSAIHSLSAVAGWVADEVHRRLRQST